MLYIYLLFIFNQILRAKINYSAEYPSFNSGYCIGGSRISMPRTIGSILIGVPSHIFLAKWSSFSYRDLGWIRIVSSPLLCMKKFRASFKYSFGTHVSNDPHGWGPIGSKFIWGIWDSSTSGKISFVIPGRTTINFPSPNHSAL